MKKLKIAAATVGWVVTTVAIGMTATSWASNGGGATAPPVVNAAPAAGAVPQAAPHVFATGAPEGIFDAITPCRIVDTLLGGGSLHNGTSRAFYVGGTTGFAPQGGKSGGCGIPVGALAITANITAVNPGGHGYLRAYPNGSSEPNATILSYAAVGSTGTGATVAINHTAAQSLKVTNHGGPVDLIIDVTGYYAQQIQGMVGVGGGIYSGGSRLVSATHDATGSYTVTVDTDVTYCTPTATAYTGHVYANVYAFNGTHLHVVLWAISDTTHLAVPLDAYFYLNIEC